MKCPACAPGSPGLHTCGRAVTIHNPVSSDEVMGLLQHVPPGYRLYLQGLNGRLCAAHLVKDQEKEDTTDAID